MFKKFAAAAALAMAASSSFAAAPVGIYAGADVGATKIDDFDTEKAIGAFVGYGFTPNVAVELGYRQHGDYEITSYAEGKLKQTHVSVVGSYPLSNTVDLYGRLGASYIDVDTKVFGIKDTEHETRALFGIGLNMNFTSNVFGRVEVQKAASDATTLNVGVGYKF